MGRGDYPDEKNKTWLTNKLTHLKHYGLAAPVYSEGRPRRLMSVRLTRQGKEELGAAPMVTVRSVAGVASVVPSPAPITIPLPAPSAAARISLNDIARDIKLYEQQNPDIELDLSIKIRKGAPVE